MKKISFFLLINLFTSLALADSLECKQRSSGYSVFNSTTQTFIGSGYYYELYNCLLAIKAKRNGVVCASHGEGSAIFKINSGDIVGSPTGYFKDIRNCNKAIYFQNNDIICASRETGSGIYDMRNEHFIGDGFYHDINNCVWASLYSTYNRTCASYKSGTAIFDRDSNDIAVGVFFPDVRQCVEVI